MARIPSSLALEDLEEILPHLVDEGLPDGGEFLVANLGEGERTASLIALMVWHGFLPMSGASRRRVDMLLGKMHLQRCVLEPSKTHVGKKVKKRAKAFRLSVNEAWSEVVDNIQRHTWTSAPGDCWLSDKMAQAYKDVESLGSKWLRGGIRFLSIELWNCQNGDLVAGEIGYTCGSTYSSCTGFSIKDKYPGAGCVQLAALGAWLAKQGFQIWDLGMELDYKLELGGQVVPRVEWAAMVRKLRHQETALPTPEGDEANAFSLLRILLPEQAAVPGELSEHLVAEGTGAEESKKTKKQKSKASRPSDDPMHPSAPTFAFS